MTDRLERLEAGMAIPHGGDRIVRVPAELAAAFEAGDRLLVVQATGDLLHVPAEAWGTARAAVDRAAAAFAELGTVPDGAIRTFYEAFAARLADDAAFAPIAAANRTDVERARARGRSTTRLELSAGMRSAMIDGLRTWRDAAGGRGERLETIERDRLRVEQVRAGVGVVGFVFEGRPNVFADATGVLRSGNAVVLRIGSDALGTARAIVEHALDPALSSAGLPAGAVALVDSAERAAGWALFCDERLALAVARGSGPAVAQLGAVARQTGTPVSLHGTGGAWIVAAPDADARAFEAVVYHSLDRKVCNTLNTCCIVRSRVDDLVPAFLSALDRAGARRGATSKLHVLAGQEGVVPEGWWRTATISRAAGPSVEPRTEPMATEALATEWEWEQSPEVGLVIVEDVDEAVDLFNAWSPRFIASLVSGDAAAHERFFQRVDAPFVGDGFTRWVDGQYALGRPELGLSSWQDGRLFGRGGVLSGDSVFTVRTRATQSDPDLSR